jgi:hypothetical protein
MATPPITRAMMRNVMNGNHQFLQEKRDGAMILKIPLPHALEIKTLTISTTQQGTKTQQWNICSRSSGWMISYLMMMTLSRQISIPMIPTINLTQMTSYRATMNRQVEYLLVMMCWETMVTMHLVLKSHHSRQNSLRIFLQMNTLRISPHPPIQNPEDLQPHDFHQEDHGLVTG